jgi:hypothetical protein
MAPRLALRSIPARLATGGFVFHAGVAGMAVITDVWTGGIGPGPMTGARSRRAGAR